MTLIPESYYKEEINIKLTQQEIDAIIQELQNVPYAIFKYFGYDKLIKKLKNGKCQT